jgi:glycosyltransferase involved in cell wall biosynthesis
MPIPRYPMLRAGFPAWRKLSRWWREDRPDIVHVATEGPLGASAVTVARRLGIPVTSSFHTNFHAYTKHYGFGPLHWCVLSWLRHVHNRTRRTFAPTAELCAELESLGFRELILMSRGVDTKRFDPVLRSDMLRAEWGSALGDPVVIHAGRMAPEKNYELLMRTYAAMREANPRTRFVLVGDGPLRSRLRDRYPSYLFTGFVSREDLAQYYASADLYVHASLSETFGNVLTEAMASGLAVMGFDYAAARQFIENGRNGLAVPCGNTDQFIKAAVSLVTNRELPSRLRREARTAVEAQSWDKVITRFEEDLARAAGVELDLRNAGVPAVA